MIAWVECASCERVGTYATPSVEQWTARTARTERTEAIALAALRGGWLYCGDWIHKRSWRQGQKTRDCKHVWLVKNELKNKGITPQDLIKQAAALSEEYVMSRRADKDHNVIDIHHQGKNVGWLTSHPGSDGDYIWIKGMYVSPEHRSKGLAHALLRGVAEDHPKQELRLRARPFRDEGASVDNLKKLYEGHGFRQYDDENRMAMKTAATRLLRALG